MTVQIVNMVLQELKTNKVNKMRSRTINLKVTKRLNPRSHGCESLIAELPTEVFSGASELLNLFCHMGV